MTTPVYVHELAVIERMSCSDDEKRSLVPLVKKLVAISELARRDGVRAVEADLPTLTPPLLRRGIEMAVDGEQPDSIRRKLYHYAVCGGATGRELFENILIMEGVLMIRNGENPRVLAHSLPALFGEAICDEIEAACRAVEAAPKEGSNA